MTHAGAGQWTSACHRLSSWFPTMSAPSGQPPQPPGNSGSTPPGKGDQGESSSSGASGSNRQAVLDIFGADLAPAAIVLVMLLLNLMKGTKSSLQRACLWACCACQPCARPACMALHATYDSEQCFAVMCSIHGAVCMSIRGAKAMRIAETGRCCTGCAPCDWTLDMCRGSDLLVCNRYL
jgi:hypothetical protein